MKAKKNQVIFIVDELEAIRIINALAEADEHLRRSERDLQSIINENWKIRTKLIKQLEN